MPLSPHTIDPCALLFGPAKTACSAATHAVSGAKNVASFATDPLGTIAKACAQAASWVVGKLADAVNATTQVDFTNPGFMKQYALVFGAATFLTLLLWVLAVAKRAVRGVPLGQAVGEAVGFLWLAVMASAFTPVLLALVVSLTDSLTSALASSTHADTTRFLTGFGKGLSPTPASAGRARRAPAPTRRRPGRRQQADRRRVARAVVGRKGEPARDDPAQLPPAHRRLLNPSTR